MNSISINSFQFLGIEKQNIKVEAVKTRGLSNLSISGLPDTALKESREKIKNLVSQISDWGPMDKVMVELSPSELSKTGNHLELPIALTCLIVLDKEIGDEAKNLIQNYSFASELSLNGELRDTPLTEALTFSNLTQFIGAAQFSTLQQLWDQIKTNCSLSENIEQNLEETITENTNNNFHIIGRTWERFCLMSACVAKLPALLIGPPGVGKSHLAQWAAHVCPPENRFIQNEQRHIWRLAMNKNPPQLPVINPHAKTQLSEFKGVQRAKCESPGLFALAHGGVLILDEFAEMNRDVREILRNIIDTKIVEKNTRAGLSIWPSNFWLILTSNPCPCGFAKGNDLSHCRCSDSSRLTYQNRISGPIWSRMGLKLFIEEEHLVPPKWFDEKIVSNCTGAKSKIQNAKKDFANKLPIARKELKKYLDELQVSNYSERKINNITKVVSAMHLLSGVDVNEIIPIFLLQQNIVERIFAK